jgi:hypothetical protein
MNDFYKKTLPLLLLTFLLSVAVRMPNINRPLAHHHEFCTAVTMTILENWWDGGIKNYGFNPVMTWQNNTDKFINNNACTSGKMLDKKGNFYYVSHPPLAYYIPYSIFCIIGQRPTVLGLQIMNLFCHFLSAFFVYLIVGLLCIKRGRSRIFYPAFIAYCVYLFNPATLWFQSNVYMSDMLVMLFFIIMTYITLKMIMREKFNVPKYLFWYAVVLAMMCYTSWLGFIFAAVVMFYSAWKLQFVGGFKSLIFTTILVTLGVLTLIVFQYSRINGIDAYLSEMITRYSIRGTVPVGRSGFFANVGGVLINTKTILLNYIYHYNLIYLWLIGIFFFVMSKRKTNFIFTRNGYRFIILSSFPILIMHIVFLEYSHQDFTVLYASLGLSVIVGVLFHKILFTRRVRPRWINISIITMCCLMVVEYWIMNSSLVRQKEETSINYSLLKVASKNKDLVLFIEKKKLDVIQTYYLKRNVMTVQRKEMAISYLRLHHYNEGIITNDGTYLNTKE